MLVRTIKVFFSWQGKHSETRNTLEDAIKKAIKELNKDESITRKGILEFDKDTQGVAGMPEITSKIIRKIEEADIWIGEFEYNINEQHTAFYTEPNEEIIVHDYNTKYKFNINHSEPVLFLRLQPLQKIENLPVDRIELVTKISEHSLTSLSLNSPTFYQRNKYGAMAVELNHDRTKLNSITQVFDNGEVWTINFDILRDSNIIETDLVEKMFNANFQNLLGFYNQLSYNGRIKVISGVSNIEDFEIRAISGTSFNNGFTSVGGYPEENNIFKTAIIEDLNNWKFVVGDIMKHIWLKFGKRYPEEILNKKYYGDSSER